MAWWLTVDQQVCLGTGLCSAMAPELLELGEEGVAVARRGELVRPEQIAIAQDVAACCPVEAIILRER
ncbi:ferredoxin [Herbidospora solisilvae]